MKIQDALKKIMAGTDLSENEMVSIMTHIMEGEVEKTQLAALLIALQMKGESITELVGAVRVMRDKAEKINTAGNMVVDTCGTGGDGAKTFNISTTVAFVAAGAGITIAKHGNRAVSSRSGSADVLKALGVDIEAKKEVVEQCLREVGVGFLFAPMMHSAMKHAAPVRKELGVRTIFNLLGPMTNPAGAQAQVIGVFDAKWVHPVAEVLKELGSKHVMVVHGADGLDEISLMEYTKICELINGKIKEYSLTPERFGLHRCKPEDVRGGSIKQNSIILQNVLAGKPGPERDIVLMNAAAAIMVGGHVDSLESGLAAAVESIDSGAAKEKLSQLCRVSNS